MKYLKTYENWFTNIFKTDNIWSDWQSDYIGSISGFGNGYNALMDAAYDGNWNRFKKLISDKRYDINSVCIDKDDNRKFNVLIDVVEGNGGLWEKKKMISALIENGIDIYFENQDGKNFYELIKEPKLKKWVEETYDIEEKLKSKKYNL